ncbi:hypothetical protein [Nocardiopsis synnemataformans]|uniref:hypothetical protein n=1 Tax=Nocardiopsis synnemataformans TaxID=61305 RepID=UPI003EB9F4C6
MAALVHPVGSTVMARDGRIRGGQPAFELRRAVVTGHVTGAAVPGYTVRFAAGHRRYVTTHEVLPAPSLDYPTDQHLTGVALRAASRTSRVPAGVSLLINTALVTGKDIEVLDYTSNPLEVTLRRMRLGRAAYALAEAVEAAQETTGRADLNEHLEALNEIGVNHRACAWDLSHEAAALVMHAEDLLDLVTTDSALANAINTHLERKTC